MDEQRRGALNRSQPHSELFQLEIPECSSNEKHNNVMKISARMGRLEDRLLRFCSFVIYLSTYLGLRHPFMFVFRSDEIGNPTLEKRPLYNTMVEAN